ncbi:hypothetical protein NQ318_007734 [Aromia moschata]|uniref:Uncharacterized protein n=1 Tax=Aromia moschata TaxID=1265417 RepID=A0AAV8Z272_9CUCU|nr:hypothetical protein NQ318_007734 [Aromia moschata]
MAQDEELILNTIEDEPHISTRNVSRQNGVQLSIKITIFSTSGKQHTSDLFLKLIKLKNIKVYAKKTKTKETELVRYHGIKSVRLQTALICGPSTYDIIHSLIAPQAVADVDLKSILDKLAVHFLPRTSTVVARFIFHRRNQRPEENISSYVKELRRLAGDCGFADTILEEMLRDRIVCGVHDENLQRRLLTEPNHASNISLSGTLYVQCSLSGGWLRINKNKQTSGQPEIKKSSGQSRVQNLEVERVNDNNSCYDILSAQDQLCSKDLVMPVKIIGTVVELQLDSGSAYTIIGENSFNTVFPKVNVVNDAKFCFGRLSESSDRNPGFV